MAIGMGPPPEFYAASWNGVLENQTTRIVVRSTLSGNRLRIRLSNQYGKQPLTIGAVLTRDSTDFCIAAKLHADSLTTCRISKASDV